jgi:hypothetical protein
MSLSSDVVCTRTFITWWIYIYIYAELGLLHHPDYRICFVLDKTSMFHVTSKTSNGTERRHQVS